MGATRGACRPHGLGDQNSAVRLDLLHRGENIEDESGRVFVPRGPPTKLFVARTLSRDWKGENMLWTIAVILLIMWLLGMVTTYTLGGLIHFLLILAVIAVLIRIIRGQNPI